MKRSREMKSNHVKCGECGSHATDLIVQEMSHFLLNLTSGPYPSRWADICFKEASLLVTTDMSSIQTCAPLKFKEERLGYSLVEEHLASVPKDWV